MNKENKLKIKISEKATELYLVNDRFKIKTLAKDLNLKPENIFELFPNRNAILDFYYKSRLLLLEDTIKKIEGYQEFTLSEKLNTVILTLLDLFQNQREYVLETYQPRVKCSLRYSDFLNDLELKINQIIESDSQVSRTSQLLIQSLFVTLFRYHFHVIVQVWSNDSSKSYSTTMALVDKWTTLVEEIFYSAVIDKSFEFIKFIATASSLADWITSGEPNPKESKI
ncbi:MAG: hypothetical protein ACFCU6_13830 [Balneolaceae bacterium]